MNTSILTRMEEDLQLLGLSERTKETYLYRAKKLLEYFNKPPEQIIAVAFRQRIKREKRNGFSLRDSSSLLIE